MGIKVTKNNGDPESAWSNALQTAEVISRSPEYQQFVENVRVRFPWRFQTAREVLDRDYLRIVDHHLQHLLPRLQPYVDGNFRRVLDFGCGSGGSAIALAMVYPDVYCCGTDIDADEIAIARDRAKLYNVADRCEFHHVQACQPLPFSDGSFDSSLCSSVIEYATDTNVRKFCVQEMVRLVGQQGLLFFSVPNRLYPFEIHTRKWGWNYFPTWFQARTVDSTFWEIRNLAKPAVLKLFRTPMTQLFTPWSNFCVKKMGA